MTVFAAWVDYVDTSTLLIFLAVFLCGLWLLNTAGGPANWPPGPKSWPVIGNADVFWNNQQLYLTLTELANIYGEMFHLRTGPGGHLVVLTGHDVIREAFVDKAEYFSNRPNFVPLVKYTTKGKGKAPIAVGHVVNESIKFRGYDMLKGTVVLPNIYQSHMEPTIWKDPFAFNPDRWLDENNNLKNNPASVSVCDL
ncbi:hypothetical protein LSAT2_029096 [Lamellibrachia satsuma]|nr:hypothetical protein LSAT2_029096 [Lamellibrachia satsuma]